MSKPLIWVHGQLDKHSRVQSQYHLLCEQFPSCLMVSYVPEINAHDSQRNKLSKKCIEERID